MDIAAHKIIQTCNHGAPAYQCSNTYLQGYWRLGRVNDSFSALAFCEQLCITAKTCFFQLVTDDTYSRQSIPRGQWDAGFYTPWPVFQDPAALTPCSLTTHKEKAVPLAPSAPQAQVLATLFLATCTKVAMSSLSLSHVCSIFPMLFCSGCGTLVWLAIT